MLRSPTLAPIVLGLTLLACGGGGGGSTPTEPPPAFPDITGSWVGTWGDASVTADLDQDNAVVTGILTITDADGEIVYILGGDIEFATDPSRWQLDFEAAELCRTVTGVLDKTSGVQLWAGDATRDERDCPGGGEAITRELRLEQP